jgi:hypothetical protein
MSSTLAVIPFSGFYNTWHDDALDRALESYFQDPDNGDAIDEFVEHAFDAVNWRQVHETYARHYAEAFAERFKIAGVEFDELNSPREYNFVTDRIFVKIPEAEVHRIYHETLPKILEEVAEEMFTSRSGFSSFYSNDVKDWGPLEEWDHNQVYALLRAYVRANEGADLDGYEQFQLMEDYHCNGYMENWLAEAGNEKFRRIDKIYSYLRDRGERGERGLSRR